MSKEGDDTLGELYGWDSTIDEVFELAPSDPQYDEDRALDAYEQIIGVGGHEQQHADAVLSLAAQLLTKHFFKFPHVHCNVVQVLVGLTAPSRPQAVRIHTIRSLLQIVKQTSSGEVLDGAARVRIQRCTDELLDKETSNMIVRQLTQLKQLLSDTAPPSEEVTNRDVNQDQDQDQDPEQDQDQDPEQDQDQDPEQDQDQNQDPNDVAMEEDASVASTRFKSKETKDYRVETTVEKPTEDEESPRNKRAQSPVRNYEGKSSRTRQDDESMDLRKKEYYQSGSTYDRNDRRPYGADSTQPRHNFGNNCPPSPYLFVGGIPRHATHIELARYFEQVDPSVTTSAIQIKMPTRNQTVYAFVTLANADLAREAIGFVKHTRFLGRNLNSDFARGPPCATMLFVELNENKTMHDEDAVHTVDFASNPDLWKEVCETLESYGEMDIIEEGKVRFRDIESAKMVIRKHHFTIFGREIIPVYDIEEQRADTAARRRRNSDTSQGFALKSGRMVGNDDSRRDSYSRDGRDDYRSSRKPVDDYHDRRYSREERHDRGMDNDHERIRERGRERDNDRNRSRKQSHSPSPMRTQRDESPRDRMPRDVLDRKSRRSESFERQPPIEARRNDYPPSSKTSTRMERGERSYYSNRPPSRDNGYNVSPELKRRDSRQNDRVSPPYRSNRDVPERLPAELTKERSTDGRRYSRSREDILNEQSGAREHSPMIVEERMTQRDRREQDRAPSNLWNDRRETRRDDRRNLHDTLPFDERKYGGGMADRRMDRQHDEPRFGNELNRHDNRPLQRQESRNEYMGSRQRSSSPVARRESNTQARMDSKMGDERDVDMNYRRSSGTSLRRSSGNSLRRQDDRSIGEIAREEQERRHLRRDRDFHADMDAPVQPDFNNKESNRSRPSTSYRTMSPPHGNREASRSQSSRHYEGPREAFSPPNRSGSPPHSGPVMRGRSPPRSPQARNDRYRSSRDDKVNSASWSGKKRTRSRSMENPREVHRGRDDREFHHNNRRDNRRERGRLNDNEEYVSRENKRVELMPAGERNLIGAQSPASPMIASPKTRREGEDSRMEKAGGAAADDMDECMVDYGEDDNEA